MSGELRRDIVRRITAGEVAQDVAWELGYSSAAVYRLMRIYKKRGDAVFEARGSKTQADADARPVKPPHQMGDKYIEYLRKTLPGHSPADLGIAENFIKPGRWSAPEVKLLLTREFGIAPSHDECARVQNLIGLRSHLRNPSKFVDWRAHLSEDFLAWQKSPTAKAQAKREAAAIGDSAPVGPTANPRGRTPIEDRPWRAALTHYGLDDPALTAPTGAALSKVLNEIGRVEVPPLQERKKRSIRNDDSEKKGQGNG